ncbi:hypothetical protein AVEN_242018-1 [Araneus ventricosus]|uniref:Uncharacterized protein n=1 Tax=Araneus ventricosus TaxID=182803 RepID=A0A4Y2VNQ7_ARAVE|nr:hypothetical protein AVEN_242018-1 [Araneus ventricosus]
MQELFRRWVKNDPSFLNINPFATTVKFQMNSEGRSSRAKYGSLKTQLKSDISSVTHTPKFTPRWKRKNARAVQTLGQKWPQLGWVKTNVENAFRSPNVENACDCGQI